LSSATGAHGSSHATAAITHQIRLAFAHSTQTVFYIMAGVMLVTFLVCVRGLPRAAPESALAAVER
jgi:hypothetical protein